MTSTVGQHEQRTPGSPVSGSRSRARGTHVDLAVPRPARPPDSGLDAEHIRDATLVVSELVTNATRYGGSCRLRLPVSGTQATVDMHDGSFGRPGVRPLTAWSESERGLAMVRCLAQRFDIDPVDGRGNRVRAVLAL